MAEIYISKRPDIHQGVLLTTFPDEEHRAVVRIRVIVPVRVQLRLVVPHVEVRTVLPVRGVNGSSCCQAPPVSPDLPLSRSILNFIRDIRPPEPSKECLN